MKTVLVIIATVAILFFQLGNNADAMCVLDKDWPDKPCYDTSPPLPLSKSEWRDVWDAYYDFKGKAWMEQKKSELDEQIRVGNLKKWIETGYESQNFANYNVWFYYYVNDKAPAPEGYELEDIEKPPISSDGTVFPALEKEFQLGKDGIAFFQSENILIRFSEVIEDSRCPIDVECIWQGRVSIDVNVIKDEQDQGNFILTLGENENDALHIFDGFFIRLLKVEPYPAFSAHDIGPYVVSMFVAEVEDIMPMDSPLKQFKSGIDASDIVCNEGLELVIKSKVGSPACVKPASVKKLVSWGWAGTVDQHSNPVDTTPDENPDTIDPKSIAEVVNLNNMFGFEMYSNLIKDKQENTFYSPYSISSAFSILYEGARGTTEDEIQSVFHFTSDDGSRREYAHQIISDLNKPSDNYVLNTANALWAQDKFPILEEYKDVTETYYLSKTENLDFATHPEESRQTINSWVEEKTNEKIKDLLPQGSINEMTRAVITNAVYFLGNWTVQFDENLTREDDFKILGQETVKVSMMNVEQNFEYGSIDDLQVLKMSYKGEDLAMLVLLPKDNDLDSLEEKLSVANLNEWTDNLTKKQVNVFLPKFKLETTYSLVEDLTNMGMPSAFDPGKADLSGINKDTDLYVTGVFHKAFVAVDERGTEAAAATGIVVGITSVGPQPEIFRADHPFIFLIQDERTGLILFIGKVVDPTKSQ